MEIIMIIRKWSKNLMNSKMNEKYMNIDEHMPPLPSKTVTII